MQLVNCRACGLLVRTGETRCPHCGAGGGRVPLAVAAVALSLSACIPTAEPEYGIADDGGWTRGDTAAATTGDIDDDDTGQPTSTSTSTSGDEGDSSSSSSATDGSSSSGGSSSSTSGSTTDADSSPSTGAAGR